MFFETLPKPCSSQCVCRLGQNIQITRTDTETARSTLKKGCICQPYCGRVNRHPLGELEVASAISNVTDFQHTKTHPETHA